MDPFQEKLTKHTGIYRCPDDIGNFKIRIKIYSNEEHTEKEFQWQQKRFNKLQKEFYANEENCITKREKEYHEIISEQDDSDSEEGFLFSNTDDDFTEEHTRENYQCEQESEYDLNSSLQLAIENPIIKENLEKMSILLDAGEYIESNWFKDERLLLLLTYNKATKSLLVNPDFTTTQPYRMTANGRNVRYFIENASKNIPETVKLNEQALIDKINNLKVSIKNLPNTFYLPPKNKLSVFISFEICSGRNFEYTDIFIEYLIDLPDFWSCPDRGNLKGRTQTCRALARGGTVNFGHCFDLLLECNLENLKKTEPPRTPCIYFEVISRDSWDRHRTEGLCYRFLPIISSGAYVYKLHCFRFASSSLLGGLRRTFIGDCRNYDDIAWIAVPHSQENGTSEGSVLNKFGTRTISTGELNVRMNILLQSQVFLEQYGDSVEENRTSRMIFEKLRSSNLIKSVEQVVQAFKRARREMAAVKSSI